MQAMTQVVPTDAAAAQELRDYVYNVAHDVGAPVRAMVEFSKLLTDEHAEKLDKEGRLYLSLIVENGQKLQAMMDGLLDYSRLNTEAQPFATVDMMKAFQNALLTLDDPIQATGANIVCNDLPNLHGDAIQIWQLFVALLDNALKFQPANNTPFVRVTVTSHDEKFWRFSIEDNGIGVDKRFHKKVFKLFQRLHAQDDYPGVGVGLTLAHKIIERHDGAIAIDSDGKAGTVVSFTLPRAMA